MAKRRRGEEPEAEQQETATGEEPEAEAGPAEEAAAEAAMLGRLTPLERAMLAFQLEPEHVLGSKVHEPEGGPVEVVIVTQGGQKLRWPADAGRVLEQHQKDGSVPGAAPAGIFKR
jgi:hypothetical protein